MDDFSAFTDGERSLLAALNRRGVRYIVVGLSAAVLQGANTAARDIDLGFEDTTDVRIGEAIPALEEALEVVRAGLGDDPDRRY